MKNIENWKISNKQSAIGMFIISIVDLIILQLTSLLYDVEKINKYLIIIVLISQFAMLIYYIENKLSKNENK